MNTGSKSSRVESGSLPDQARLLLLRACLCPGQEAVDAWRAWQEKVAFDDLDVASMRLIPMLYHNLRTLGVEDADFGRYQGLSRRSWYMNQLLFRGAASVLGLFRESGIRTLVLKGVPLAHLYYPETGLRPMFDFDLLVPRDQASPAIALLQSSGWKPDASPLLKVERPSDYPPRGWNFTNGAGDKLDLHWRTLGTSLSPDADDSFWAGAEPFTLGGVDTLTLNATDHFLHTCVHGLPANFVAPMRWVVDAMMIVRRREIDRERLLTHVRNHRVSVMMNHALNYLCENFDAPVPDPIRRSLAQIQPEPWEHSEFAVIIRPESTIRGMARVVLSRFRRQRCTTPFLAARSPIAAFLKYLQLRWCLAHVRQVPIYALRSVVREIAAIIWRSVSRAVPASPSAREDLADG